MAWPVDFSTKTTLCETLAPIQGRKMMLFFTAGMGQESRLGTVASLRLATNTCNRVDVLIYPLDVSGFPR